MGRDHEVGRGLRTQGSPGPQLDDRLIDLSKAAESKDYCDEFMGKAAENGATVTELSMHLQVELVAVHPAYDTAFDGFSASNPACFRIEEGGGTFLGRT